MEWFGLERASKIIYHGQGHLPPSQVWTFQLLRAPCAGDFCSHLQKCRACSCHTCPQLPKNPNAFLLSPFNPTLQTPLHAFSCKLRNHKHPGKTWQQIPPSPGRFFLNFFFSPSRNLEEALVLMDLSLPHQKLDEW